MLTIIAFACVLFGWICAASVARHPTARAAAHLVGAALTVGLVGMVYEESLQRQKLAGIELDARIQATLASSQSLLDQITADQRLLAERCGQYPSPAGC